MSTGAVPRVHTLGWVTIGTVDVDAAVAFYRDVLRLQVRDRGDGWVDMTGGPEKAWVRIEHADTNGVQSVTYLVEADVFDVAVANVAAEGIDVTTAAGHARFVDPAGQMIELRVPGPAGDHRLADPGVGLLRPLHAVWHAPDLAGTVAFYERALGFRVSDRIADAAAFLRCADGYHHSLALLAGPSRFHHLCILVDDLDDVMTLRSHVMARGVGLQADVLRHAPSGSVGIYVKDDVHGLAVEYCWDHEWVGDDHEPGDLPLAADTFDVWQTPLPELRS